MSTTYAKTASAMAHAARALRDRPRDSGVIASSLRVLSRGFDDVELPTSPLELSKEEAEQVVAAAASEMVEAFTAASLEFLDQAPSREQHLALADLVDPLWRELAGAFWPQVSEIERARVEAARALVIVVVARMYAAGALPLNVSPVEAVTRMLPMLDDPESPISQSFGAYAQMEDLTLKHVKAGFLAIIDSENDEQ